jgi:hypothetical protein
MFCENPSEKEKAVKSFKIGAGSLILALIGIIGLSSANAQKNPSTKSTKSMERKAISIARGANLYCAGYVETGKIDQSMEVVGSDDEPEKFNHSEGDFVYINVGSDQGVKVGDEFSVIRPKGKVSNRNTKKTNLGVYVEEIGGLEVVSVRKNVAVAFVKSSCDSILYGDLLHRTEKRTSPMSRQVPMLDRFADANGKTLGQIVFAKDGRELLSRDQIVYIDLGEQDSVKSGDYLTVFRPLGKGNPFNPGLVEDSNPARNRGFESEEYKGGSFSSQTPRKSGDEAQGGVVQAKEAKSRRPAGLRKVVGEIVILSVREKTATALITRTATEIHTGDMVEIQ